MTRITLFFLLCAAFISCTNDKEKVEPEPDNYFFANINGQPWMPNSFYKASIFYRDLGSAQPRTFSILGFKDNDGIFLTTSDFAYNDEYYYVPRTYTDTSVHFAYLHLYFGFMHKSGTNILYTTGNRISGRMTLTAQNMTTKKISGTFEFTAVDTLNGNYDTLRVTDGVFVNYDYVYYP